MAKSFNKVFRKHRKKILIAIVVVFAILIICGLMLGPDKTWHNLKVEETRQSP